jgi:hypothetical protein
MGVNKGYIIGIICYIVGIVCAAFIIHATMGSYLGESRFGVLLFIVLSLIVGICLGSMFIGIFIMIYDQLWG